MHSFFRVSGLLIAFKKYIAVPVFRTTVIPYFVTASKQAPCDEAIPRKSLVQSRAWVSI